MNIDLQIVRWPVERLIPRATNPRTHSPAQIAQVARSIQEFGWTNPDSGRGGQRYHRRSRAANGGEAARHDRSSGGPSGAFVRSAAPRTCDCGQPVGAELRLG